MLILSISLKCLQHLRSLLAAQQLILTCAILRSSIHWLSIVQTTGSLSSGIKMETTSVQVLSKDWILLNGLRILFYIPLTSSSLISPINVLESKILQLVSSFQNISGILICQIFVVFLNGCECSKGTVRISPNVAQILCHLGLPPKRIPSKRQLKIGTITLGVSHNLKSTGIYTDHCLVWVVPDSQGIYEIGRHYWLWIGNGLTMQRHFNFKPR